MKQRSIGAAALGSSFPSSVFILAAAGKISVGALCNGNLIKDIQDILLAVKMEQHTILFDWL